MKSITKVIAILLALVFLGLIGCTNNEKSAIKYPYQFKFEGNPLVRLHGAADPDVHVWVDTVWMYCSQDRIMKYINIIMMLWMVIMPFLHPT